MSSRIRLGVVGLGRAAARMLPSLADHPEVSVVACADPHPTARERFVAEFSGAELSGAAFATAEELCSRGKIDAAFMVLHQGVIWDWKKRQALSADTSPKLETEDTSYGMRHAAIRKTTADPDKRKYVRVNAPP